jgi:uncharacterized protein
MNAMVVHEIETPCVKLCVVDPESGFCIGCGRTRMEIGLWLEMSVADRRTVMADLGARVDGLTRMKTRRGGRRGRIGGG